MRRTTRPLFCGHIADRRLLPFGKLILLTLATCCGCARSPSEAPSPSNAQQASVPLDREIWEAIYIQGSKIGYGHTKIRQDVEDGQEVVRIEGHSHLVIKRYGSRIEQDLLFTSIETRDVIPEDSNRINLPSGVSILVKRRSCSMRLP